MKSVETTDEGHVLPGHLPPALRQALREAKAQLRETYGDRLRRVVLYGSQARGDARPTGHPQGASDVDVLVVLDEPLDVYAETTRFVNLGLAMFSGFGTYFSFKPFTVEDFQDPACPFMRRVRAEG